ncbi:Card1-like endonuclease domain-containing protein [Yeosuana sp.]|uniref:Card1-like endonuclease domain-containing protein n=1 Tax=Yeosuana sp. TaxID=2529388 RepID=UPI004054EFA9
MKKHQITLLGGQILPVYWGVLEKQPDIVELIYTKETRLSVGAIKSQFKGIIFNTHQVDPYDYKGIKELIEEIVISNEVNQFQLNLTSGTKVMALACQSVFKTLELDVFYIDQNNRLFDLNKEEFTTLQSNLSIKTLIELSGHQNYSAVKLSDFSKKEIELSKRVLEFTRNNSGLTALFGEVRKKYNKEVRNKFTKIEDLKSFSIKTSNAIVSWNSPSLKIIFNNSKIECSSEKAFKIIFGGLWWEILIAETTQKWSKTKELLMSVSIQTKKDSGLTKNEIDVVLNTGQNFIFIECKSGNVLQEDINKIRAVKSLYGGIGSKSILICRYVPRADLIEKCNDLGIEIFSYETSFNKNKGGKFTSFKSLDDINKKLDLLLNKMDL